MSRTTPRRRLSAAARREQILDVALDLVGSAGFHAATPQRLADEAGVSRTVLYQQFGDVPSLLVALVEREGDRATEQFLAACGEVPSSGEPLVDVFAGALRAVDAHPRTWRLLLFPPEGAPPQLHERVARDQASVRLFIRGELERAFPLLPDPELGAAMVHAGGRELLQQRLLDPATMTPERLLDLIRTLVSLGAGVGR